MAKRGKRRQDLTFWNRDYKTGTHIASSTEPSEDFVTFVRWLQRTYGKAYTNVTTYALDLGCGNGRNLIYLAREYGVRGMGIDIANEALATARRSSDGLSLTFRNQSIAEPLPLADASCDLVLDMMTSHVLWQAQREALYREIARVTKPGGFLFFKTFLREDDAHAERLLKEHPTEEAGTYYHPTIGAPEHVFTLDEIADMLGDAFTIHKTKKSFLHIKGGKPFKRRNVCVYAQRTNG